jgi:hypothetical protein
MPLTEIYDNDNMPYIRPLDPALCTLGSMLRTAGYYCAYQGKWHLSRAYKDPNDPRPTTDALEPYGFSEFNDWGDLDGGAWAGLKIDPVSAGQAVKWAAQPAPVVAQEQPWFLTVNVVNPHDVMSYDYGGRRLVAPPPNLAKAMVVRPPADVPLYSKSGTGRCPPLLMTICRVRPRRCGSTPRRWKPYLGRSRTRLPGGWVSIST